MANQTKRIISLSLLFIITFALVIDQYEANSNKKSDDVGTGTGGTNGAVPVERAIGVPPGLTSHWGAVVDWAKLAWINFRQPESWYGSTKSGRVKEVVTQSFETSKETVEAAADAAAKAVGNAADVAKKTLKRTVAFKKKDDSSTAEL